MHVDPLEKRWLYFVGLIVAVTIAVQVYFAAAKNINPPSNVETINPATMAQSGEFAEKNLGVHKNADGSYRVTMVAARYGFYPQEVVVPADTPVTFRISSFDVLHGLLVPYSNLNLMVVPGYVSEGTTTFTKVGEFPMICNEYCGIGHDYMYARVRVVPKNN